MHWLSKGMETIFAMENSHKQNMYKYSATPIDIVEASTGLFSSLPENILCLDGQTLHPTL